MDDRDNIDDTQEIDGTDYIDDFLPNLDEYFETNSNVVLDDDNPNINIVKLNDDNIVEDFEEQDKSALKIRNKHYNNLLNHYVNHIDKSLSFKQENREIVFKLFIWAFIVILLTISCLIFGILWYGEMSKIQSVSVIITALATLITTLFIIPTKISEFIYNPNEDTQIGEVIKNLQEYDKSLRENLYKKNNDSKE